MGLIYVMFEGWKVESWLICDDTRHRQVNIGGNYTMVQISAVLGIVCYFVLAGSVVASTKTDRSDRCMGGDYDIGGRIVVCRRCKDV